MEKKAISSDLIRGHIDTIILHTLLDGDKFAQQISDSVEEKSQNEYQINQATLYSSLKRLESLKYVKGYWFDSPTGRRKYFKLTDSGKQTVEQNLSSWSYSRAIIDKLIDCTPQPIYQTKIVEKIVEVPVEKTVYVQENTSNLNNLSNNSISNIKADKLIEKTEIKTENKTETSQDVNFRNIINGLIKSTVIQKSAPVEIKPINKGNNQDFSDEKLNFNEAISKTGYTSDVKSSAGKVDFSDLMIKAVKEGYKLRISSKDSGVAPGKFLINKINIFSALAIYLVVMLEFLFFTSYYKSVVDFTSGIITAIIIVLTIFPVVRLIQFVKSPMKKISKGVSADKILTASIIVFNLLIITFAVYLISGTSFDNLKIFIPTFVMPCVLYVDFIAYYIIKYVVAKFSAFVVKPKKTAI